MAEVEVKPATTGHAKALASNMAPADVAECMGIGGLGPRQALRRSMDNALASAALVVNGEVLAIWGVHELRADLAVVWLLTSTTIQRWPMLFVRMYRREVASLLTRWPTLVNFIDARHEKALRIAKMTGAELADPAPFGPRGHVCVRATWRRTH